VVFTAVRIPVVSS